MKTRRLNVLLPATVFADLEQLSDRTGRSLTALVRTGLGLLYAAHRERLVVATKEGAILRELVV